MRVCVIDVLVPRRAMHAAAQIQRLKEERSPLEAELKRQREHVVKIESRVHVGVGAKVRAAPA